MRLPGVKTIAAAVTTAAFLLPAASGHAACPSSSAGYGSAGAPLASSPNDPLFPHQWGLTQIKAPGAWALGAFGAGATIAVVDSGADLSHPDLAANLAPGYDVLSGGACAPQDLNGHGTHVAGIAAAVTNNGIGVAGTAPLAKIIPVRVLDATGNGSTDQVAAGIKWAADHGAGVINLSLGDTTPLPLDLSGISNAVNYAYAKGAVIVAAAGNEDFPFCEYPAMSSNAICVAANDSSGFPALYSNFPLRLDGGVAVRAPGGDGSSGCGDANIWSTYWPGAPDDTCGPKGYEPIAGTSMAAPFVSGIAAMLRAAGQSNAQVMDCIRRTSSNGGSYDPIRGYGNVDAQAAIVRCVPPGTSLGQLPPSGQSGQSTGEPTPPTGQTTAPQPGEQQGVLGEHAASDTTAPRIRVTFSGGRKAHAARLGYCVIRVRLSEPAAVRLRVLSGRETAIAGRNALVLATGAAKLRTGVHDVKLKLTRAGRRVIRHRRILTATVLADARDGAGNDGTAIAEGKIRR
jgi:subtilisin family serine protease